MLSPGRYQRHLSPARGYPWWSWVHALCIITDYGPGSIGAARLFLGSSPVRRRRGIASRTRCEERLRGKPRAHPYTDRIGETEIVICTLTAGFGWVLLYWQVLTGSPRWPCTLGEVVWPRGVCHEPTGSKGRKANNAQDHPHVVVKSKALPGCAMALVGKSTARISALEVACMHACKPPIHSQRRSKGRGLAWKM